MVRFFFSSRRRHTRCSRDWSSDVCSSDLASGFLATERAEPALESAHGGAEGRGYRHLEEEVVRVAGPLEGDEVLVRDLVGVQGHLVDVAGEVGRDVLTPWVRTECPREHGVAQLARRVTGRGQHAIDEPLDEGGVAPRSVTHAASMGTRQLVVKRAAARPRVAEPLFMAYDSAAHEPARVPTRGPDGHEIGRAHV